MALFFPEVQEQEIKTEVEEMKVEDDNALSNMISGDLFPMTETNERILGNSEQVNLNPFLDNLKEENDIKIEEEDLPSLEYSSVSNQQELSQKKDPYKASIDFEEEALLLLLLQQRRRRRQQQRRSVWMQPLTSGRVTDGEFNIMMKNLRSDNVKFFNYFRMSQDSFNHLLTLIKPHIQRADTQMRSSIPAEERLAITLRYLVSGCSLRELHLAFRCGISTINGIINDVCKKIVLHLHGLCFPELATNDWLSIAETFKSQANFPNCIGAIDRKYVLVTPPRSSTANVSQKFFHLMLMAVCDAEYRLIFVDINFDGKISEYSKCTNTVFLKKIYENSLNIPDDSPVSVNGIPLPFVFVGDEVFQPSNHILTPYCDNKDISKEKKIFNYRLSRARRYVESAFGILTNKWHIFHKPLDVNIKSAENIVRACCILHNFVIKHDGVQFEDTLTVVGLDEGVTLLSPCPQSAERTKEKFAEYFSSEEGSIPWQARMIKD